MYDNRQNKDLNPDVPSFGARQEMDIIRQNEDEQRLARQKRAAALRRQEMIRRRKMEQLKQTVTAWAILIFIVVAVIAIISGIFSSASKKKEDDADKEGTAVSETDMKAVPSSEVRDQLKELFGARGAMFCQYDFFRLFYQLQARTIVRSGDVIHIALFSVHGQDRKALPRRSLDRVMDNLQELLINNLRQGDVITRCSVSQLIIMLPQANYEDSCAVCQRLLKAFRKQYPHSPAEISFSVQPLEPHIPEAETAAT